MKDSKETWRKWQKIFIEKIFFFIFRVSNSVFWIRGQVCTRFSHVSIPSTTGFFFKSEFFALVWENVENDKNEKFDTWVEATFWSTTHEWKTENKILWFCRKKMKNWFRSLPSTNKSRKKRKVGIGSGTHIAEKLSDEQELLRQSKEREVKVVLFLVLCLRFVQFCQ